MKKVLGIAVALVLALSAGAFAADVEGKIQSVDTSDRVIVLDNGDKLWIADGVAMDKLKEGANVKASYEQRDGKNVVTGIEVSE
jgi:Protein of unknown function (DUF1344)